jgi:hypothetical protein
VAFPATLHLDQNTDAPAKLCVGLISTICTRLSSLAQWMCLEEGQHTRIELPEAPKRGASQEGLWGQIDTEFAARRPPHGSGRHLGQQGRVPKEEPLACSAAVPQKGLTVAVNRSSQVMRPLFKSTFAGLLCEGSWLALLSCQMFGTQSPSVLKDAWGLQRAGADPRESQRIGVGIEQILTLPSKPAGPVPWAQTA